MEREPDKLVKPSSGRRAESNLMTQFDDSFGPTASCFYQSLRNLCGFGLGLQRCCGVVQLDDVQDSWLGRAAVVVVASTLVELGNMLLWK